MDEFVLTDRWLVQTIHGCHPSTITLLFYLHVVVGRLAYVLCYNNPLYPIPNSCCFVFFFFFVWIIRISLFCHLLHLNIILQYVFFLTYTRIHYKVAHNYLILFIIFFSFSLSQILCLHFPFIYLFIYYLCRFDLNKIKGYLHL